MNDAMDLKTLERTAWRSYHQDGLWDLYLGLILWALAIFLGGGLDAVENDLWRLLAYTVLIGGAFLIFWAGKRYITAPRLGRVKFGPARKRRMLHLALILGGFTLVTVVLVILTATAKSNNTSLPPGLPVYLFAGLFVGAVIATIAWFNDYPRGYYIAGIYALCFGLGEYWQNWSIFWLGGLLVLTPGVVLLIRFLRQYPSPEPGETNG
jgi:hypothetical protein